MPLEIWVEFGYALNGRCTKGILDQNGVSNPVPFCALIVFGYECFLLHYQLKDDSPCYTEALAFCYTPPIVLDCFPLCPSFC